GTPADPRDDFIVYTPAAGFSGADGFTYTVADGHGHSSSARVTVTVNPPSMPPVAVESVVINDGTAQRSMVTSITVTFSGVVVIDAGAFELRNQADQSIGVSVSISAAGGKTVVVLTF